MFADAGLDQSLVIEIVVRLLSVVLGLLLPTAEERALLPQGGSAGTCCCVFMVPFSVPGYTFLCPGVHINTVSLTAATQHAIGCCI